MRNTKNRSNIIVPIRFSEAATVSIETLDLLKLYGEKLWDLPFKSDWEIAQMLPLSKPGLEPNKDFIEPIMSSLGNFENPDFLILDFGGVRARTEPLDFRIGTAFRKLLSEISRDFDLSSVAAAIGFRPDESDHLNVIFEDYLSSISSSAILDYSTGKIWSRSVEKTTISKLEEELSRSLIKTKPSLEQKLGSSLVCHLGNFQLSDNERKIHDFYDGSFARDIVYQSLTYVVDDIRVKTGRKNLNILFDDGGSAWFDISFANAIIEAGQKVETNISVVAFPVSGFESIEPEPPMMDALVVPVIRSGHTISKILDRLEALGHRELPEIYCVVYANADVSAEGFCYHNIVVDFEDREEEIDFYSLVQRGSRGKLLSEIWAGIGETTHKPNQVIERRTIPSDTMWGMIFESGLKDTEEWVPDDRDGLAWVPDYDEILKRNGPYFATRVVLHQRYLHGLLQTDEMVGVNFFFVMPNEPSMNIIGRHLNFLYDRECSIYVDHDIIEMSKSAKTIGELSVLLKNDEKISQSALDNFDNLFSQYLTRSSVNSTKVAERKIFILNEFSQSGLTLKALRDLSVMLGWEVEACISLARQPGLSRGKITAKFEADHYLYEFGNA